MYYLLAIREDAPSSSEARDTSEEVKVASIGAVLAKTSPKELAKESEPSGAAGANEGQNPDATLETVEATGDAPISYAKGPVLLVEPL